MSDTRTADTLSNEYLIASVHPDERERSAECLRRRTRRASPVKYATQNRTVVFQKLPARRYIIHGFTVNSLCRR